MGMLEYLGPFFLLLGVLVFFHELGHFAVAKWLGVNCERFAIGFGPSLLRYRYGETEYVLNWLPLGGYVKMAGEHPDDEVSESELARSFYGQSPLRRTAIALAGPAMNLLLSVVVIAGVLMTAGWPVPTSRIGSVVPDSPAARAGLQGGDRIVALGGDPVSRWDDLVQRIRESGTQSLELTVERDGEQFEFTATPEPVEPNGRPMLGIETGVPEPVLVFPDPESPGARAGLRSGDVVTAVAGAPVGDQYRLEWELEHAPAGPIEIEAERTLPGGETETVRVTVPAPDAGAEEGAAWSLERLGSVPVEFLVAVVGPATPAKNAGIQVGDLILAVNGERVRSREDLASRIESGGSPLELELLRAGETQRVSIEPAEGIGSDDAVLTLGVQVSRAEVRGGELMYEVERNPFVALGYGVTRTYDYFIRTLDSLRMLATREIGMGNLTGPIGIGEIAADTFDREIRLFLQWLCIISVNLAIINLLPIPVLDGGHILFAAAEAVRGGPLGQRAREVAQTIGLGFVVMLMGLAFWNDLSRSWPRIVSFFQDLL